MRSRATNSIPVFAWMDAVLGICVATGLTFDYRLRCSKGPLRRTRFSLQASGLERDKKFLGICDSGESVRTGSGVNGWEKMRPTPFLTDPSVPVGHRKALQLPLSLELVEEVGVAVEHHE